MIKIFCAFISLFASISLFANDFTKAELDILKALQGDYVNSKGDQLSLETTMSFTEQLDLFEDNSPFLDSLEMEFELSNSVYGSYYTDDRERNVREMSFDKDSVNFIVSYDDCDNPGCTNYEVEISFIKNSNNSYDVVAEGLATTHFEEPELPALDNADDYEEKYYELYTGYKFGTKQEIAFFEAQLEQACIRQFGDTATVNYFEARNSDLFSLRLYCDHTISTTLVKK